jgi:hypothetical protein
MPQLRIELAVHQYQTEDISLAKAAHLAGISYDNTRPRQLGHVGVPARPARGRAGYAAKNVNHTRSGCASYSLSGSRVVLVTLALASCAAETMALRRSAPSRLAPVMSAMKRFAPQRLAWERLASIRSTA